MIEVQQLRKHFGAVKAVDGVSFKANDGQITGLLGPNGAGKTTTLRMLYTLMKPDSGTVLVDQINAFAESNQARRRLGVLPDARGLYKRLSAAENIEYFGQLHGLEPELIRQRIAQLEQRLDLGEILHRRTEGFSQGQRVKTALARWEPRITLEDVVVATNPEDPRAVDITIIYTLIATRQRERVGISVALQT